MALKRSNVVLTRFEAFVRMPARSDGLVARWIVVLVCWSGGRLEELGGSLGRVSARAERAGGRCPVRTHSRVPRRA